MGNANGGRGSWDDEGRRAWEEKWWWGVGPSDIAFIQKLLTKAVL